MCWTGIRSDAHALSVRLPIPEFHAIYLVCITDRIDLGKIEKDGVILNEELLEKLRCSYMPRGASLPIFCNLGLND